VFKITVPRPSSIGGTIITRLEATIRVAEDPRTGATKEVAFQVTDPRTVGPVAKRFPTAEFHPTAALGSFQDFTPPPPGTPPLPDPTFADSAIMAPPPAPIGGLPDLDPNRERYKLVVNPKSDYNFQPDGSIASTLAADDHWTIDLQVPGTGTNSISSVCVQSFTFAGGISGSAPILLPASGAFVENTDFPGQNACSTLRPPIDVILVLDHSGSMSSSTTGSAPRPKIEALRSAVADFVGAWADIRTTEGSAAPTDDNLGVILFDSTATWWSTIPDAGIVPFTTAHPLITTASLATIAPAGSTSIGAGLLLADAAFATASNTRRRVVLVMSNGMQNTDPLVGVTPVTVPPTPRHVFTHPSTATSGPNLPNQANYQIYSVTVGTGVAVSAAINEDIAKATKGFYVNSENSAEPMRTFFLELLQNFVRFNTWETARLASGTVTPGSPFDIAFPVASTTASLAVVVAWPERHGRLEVTITPPGEAPVSAVGSGTVRRTFDLTAFKSYDPLGTWRVSVAEPGDIESGAPDLEHGQIVPVEITVLVDDKAVNADLDIVPADYMVGDPVKLHAGMTEFGQPLTGLGTRPGESVVAEVLRPGEGIGDLLAGSNAPSTPAPTGDQQSPAEAKLFNELQQNPGALKHVEDVITLTDPSGTGVYAAEYATKEPGHYTFLFGVQGRTNEAGVVSRQQLKTVYVRPVPNPSTTSVSTTTRAGREVNQLILTVTPKTKFGNLLGPGYANYLWFTSPGRPAFKGIDDLKGSYTATLDYSGSQIPPVRLHFFNVSIVITDDVTPDALPPFDDRTVVIPQIPGTGSQAKGCLLILETIIRRILKMLGL
jgi:Mg-chelatase subunit ChlD